MGTIIPNMGKTHKQPASLASALFSKVQLRLLSLFMSQPEQAFHTSQIIKRIQSGTGAVQRELERLAQSGILKSRADGNRRLYQANRDSPIFNELSQIILKTTGLVEPIRDALKQLQNKIHFAFVFGSVAKGLDTASSDIDLMIVGEDLSYSEIFNAIQRAEKILGRPINPNLMTLAEWEQKLSDENSFVVGISQQPKFIIQGDIHDLQSAG